MLAYIDRRMREPKKIIVETQMSLAELDDSIWIDLFDPSKAEEYQVEQYIGRNVPTREEMIEIEFSSRLYKENDVLFMTAMMIEQSNSSHPKLDPVTFVLTQEQLITIRYIEPKAFELFTSQIKKIDVTHRDAVVLFITLLDAAIDRLADILELVESKLDHYSQTIFNPQNITIKLDYRRLMQEIGANSGLNTKARESLVTFNRLISFFGQTAHSRIDHPRRVQIATLNEDVASLSDYANFLSTKINFLLDATLGMVNIEQNNIIKIFSVAAVIFLPPTLVASIYGMNFHSMPELSWKYGYLLAISMILFAAWLPYKYFKYRKWL